MTKCQTALECNKTDKLTFGSMYFSSFEQSIKLNVFYILSLQSEKMKSSSFTKFFNYDSNYGNILFALTFNSRDCSGQNA